jgi:hypothetical protein
MGMQNGDVTQCGSHHTTHPPLTQKSPGPAAPTFLT